MKPNVIVALLVGLVIGFAGGKVVGGPQSGSSDRAATAPAPAGNVGDESGFAHKSADMPAGTFTGMTDVQKWSVMKVMNENNCLCGCGRGSLANCIKTDPNCPNSPAKLKQVVELAKAGKDAAAIQQEMFGAAQPSAPTPPRPTPDNTTVFRVPLENAPIQGPEDALVTMVEFSDYECPFCSRAHATVQQLQKDYGSKLRVAMKQNPLSFHPRAQPAALAALAAGQQGKYWQMHDKMFANARALDDQSLENYAKEMGLNVAKWKADMADPKHKETISKDQTLAQSLGATGTPAFFINGRKISGAQPIEQFKSVIDQEIAKTEQMVKEGVRKGDIYAKVLEKGVTTPPAPQGAPPAAPAAGAVKKVDIPGDSPSKGPKHAKVTIVEWSDFECPFCSRVGPTLKQIEQTYGKDVKVVFRHQPLSFHPNAKLAAAASMAAHEQGKFWEYHDKLFANQKALQRADLEKYAQELGLNMAKFKAALDTGKYNAKIEQDAAAGSAVGANGTPTFYINGREQVGAGSFETFKGIIDQEIAKADKLLASGVKLEQLYEKVMSEAGTTVPAAAQAPAPAAQPVKQVNVGNAPVHGPKDAPVTIVAFSDFQCPFCSRAVPTLKQIEETYKGKVRIAFKNQPLPFHSNARIAAAAALAAHEQGKFWEYHDKLFANQQALDRASLEKYAEEMKLDMKKFRTALDTNKFEAQISAESAEGTQLGADGTPTFFINGRQLVGAQPFDQFKQIIDDELGKKGGKGAAPVDPHAGHGH